MFNFSLLASKKKPQMLSLNNTHFLLYMYIYMWREISTNSLMSLAGGCLLAGGWQGVCFTQGSEAGGASPCCTGGWHTRLLPWLPQREGEGPGRDQWPSPDWHCHRREGKPSQTSRQRPSAEHKQPTFTHERSVQVMSLNHALRHENILSSIISPAKMIPKILDWYTDLY